MISNLDIYRAATVIINRYGEDAPIHAAMRADAMLDKGFLDVDAEGGRAATGEVERGGVLAAAPFVLILTSPFWVSY